jgi:hypothetical protein
MPVFDSPNDEVIYNLAKVKAGRRDQIGTVEDLGWFARLDNVQGFDWIVAETRDGKVLVRQFARASQGVKPAWAGILIRYYQFYGKKPKS